MKSLVYQSIFAILATMSFDSGLDHDEHEVHPVKQRCVNDSCFKEASRNASSLGNDAF